MTELGEFYGLLLSIGGRQRDPSVPQKATEQIFPRGDRPRLVLHQGRCAGVATIEDKNDIRRTKLGKDRVDSVAVKRRRKEVIDVRVMGYPVCIVVYGSMTSIIHPDSIVFCHLPSKACERPKDAVCGSLAVKKDLYILAREAATLGIDHQFIENS